MTKEKAKQTETLNIDRAERIIERILRRKIKEEMKILKEMSMAILHSQ